MAEKLMSAGVSVKGGKAVKLGMKLFGKGIKNKLYRSVKFPRTLPSMVNIAVTHKCNSYCKVCNIWQFYKKDKKKVKEEMTFKEFKTFVDKNSFLQDIILTGGEVFLKDDIVDFWLYLDKKGYRTGSPCNAVDVKLTKRKTEELLSKLSGKHAHQILFSIDGLGKTHDYIRGCKGNFNNAVHLLKWASELKKRYGFVDVQISHNITSSNYNEFPKFIDYFIKMGLKPSQIVFRPAQFSERFENKSSKELVSGEVNKKIIDVIKKVQKKYRYYRNDVYVNGLIYFLKNPDKLVVPCYAAYSFCYIDPYWNLYPCTMDYTIIGNLRKNNLSIKKLWYTKKANEIRDRIKKGRCPKCWNRCHGLKSMISDPIQILKLAYYNRDRIISNAYD